MTHKHGSKRGIHLHN